MTRRQPLQNHQLCSPPSHKPAENDKNKRNIKSHHPQKNQSPKTTQITKLRTNNTKHKKGLVLVLVLVLVCSGSVQ